jgi:hypothetical protein
VSKYDPQAHINELQKKYEELREKKKKMLDELMHQSRNCESGDASTMAGLSCSITHKDRVSTQSKSPAMRSHHVRAAELNDPLCDLKPI